MSDMLKPLRPAGSRKLPVSAKVSPASERRSVIGTAFDYLLRFELQRRVPTASVGEWVAENAPLWMRSIPNRLLSGDLRESDDFDADMAETVATQAEAILKAAHVAVEEYRLKSSPSDIEIAGIASHALRLARLDAVCRPGYLDPRFAEVAQEDIQELVALLAIVPFSDLLNDTMILNPTFGTFSRLVGGADGDLISGSTLIDVKVTAKTSIEAVWLDQLLGYYFLARNYRREDPSFPNIERAGIYFGRQGFLWTMSVRQWTGHTNFSAIEAAFFREARRIRSS